MFPDPIKDHPKGNNGMPYDERTGIFVNQGTHHGVGYTNPVGHEGNAKQTVATLPQKSKCAAGDQRG